MAIDLGAGTVAVDLLPLLPSGGGMSLLGIGLVGLFLADRALAPVRLAWNKRLTAQAERRRFPEHKARVNMRKKTMNLTHVSEREVAMTVS
jgi:hypothetical protein